MQTMSGSPTTHQRTISQESDHRDGAESGLMTPAERIALSIALLNRGLDWLDGVARSSLGGCTRGQLRPQHDPKQNAPLSHR